MKYLSSDNCIYKLSLGYNLLNPFLILWYFTSTLGSFLYGAIQSSLQTVENIIQPSPEKKKRKLQFVRAYFIQNHLYLSYSKINHLSPTVKWFLVTFFLWEIQTRRNWFYSVSHKGSKTSQNNCLREYSHDHWCQCDKQENWSRMLCVWHGILRSSAKEMQAHSLPFTYHKGRDFCRSGRKMWERGGERKKVPYKICIHLLLWTKDYHWNGTYSVSCILLSVDPYKNLPKIFCLKLMALYARNNGLLSINRFTIHLN